MKITLFTAVALAVALSMPAAGFAQQSQQPGVRSQHSATPSQAKIQHHWMKRLGSLNLSGDQQQHIQSLINQFSQAHPEGSPRDPTASRELRRQIMGLLTNDQQNQLRSQMQARREQMQQRRGEQQQAPGQSQYQGPAGQGAPSGPPDQGPPNQGPPNQGPPNQGPPNQGPPDQQPPDQQPPA